MQLQFILPAKSLNKSYRKQSLKQEQIDTFNKELNRLLNRINDKESEENQKNIVADFLKETYYRDRYEINTKDRKDLVIHNGKTAKESVGVIIEAKKPNSAERITKEKLNVKALHELILYYFDERDQKRNVQIKYLIATNSYEWFIFNENDFDKLFYRNTKIKTLYNAKNSQQKDNPFFYSEVAKIITELTDIALPGTYVNLKDVQELMNQPAETHEDQQTVYYKLFSPEHLLKQQFANDSNSLDRDFYNELLYIVGLKEYPDGGKKLIKRVAEADRQEGSLLENTINILRVRNKLNAVDNLPQYGATDDEQVFSIALELCLTWLNRMLFLKLLEGQLIAYHRDNPDYAFLNSRRIQDFDELEELFFEVLAVETSRRSASVREKFANIPYLNSSLFEISVLENQTIQIADLKDRLEMPMFGTTVLKDGKSKRLHTNKNTLQYLFEFLEAYDFASDSSAKIQKENKTIINASVLGLIFEKINGYKDGSFFTPGFITMYMCRETLRKAVVEKFNAHYSWRCTNFAALKDKIDYTEQMQRQQANELIDSLKICDPAVGSGHFLVSALNELIAIKSELQVLSYRDGSRVKAYAISVENDELMITDRETGLPFAYVLNQQNKSIEALQTLQETLFYEKRTIIENGLFGVDINPKSVMICRLRLWIELLKNAYYTAESGYAELQTLPNIDINIKTGNSLISRFALNRQPDVLPKDRKRLQLLTSQYKDKVALYKHAPDMKQALRKEIAKLKEEFQNFALPNDKEYRKVQELRGKLSQMVMTFDAKDNAERETLALQLSYYEKQYTEKLQHLYGNAFEWRFEFPEVLDEDGEFTGFDAVLGNPPYGVDLSEGERKAVPYNKIINDVSWNTAFIFFELGYLILKKNGNLSFIVPKGVAYVPNLENVRRFLCEKVNTQLLIDTSEAFNESGVQLETIILSFAKDLNAIKENITTGYTIDKRFVESSVEKSIVLSSFKFGIWLNDENFRIIEKIQSKSISLGNIYDSKRGIGINKYVTETEDDTEDDIIVLGGRYIERYHYSGISYTNSKHIEDKHLWVSKSPKILLQEIVGRFGKPLFGNFRKIKLNANLDLEGIYTLDTVVNLFNHNPDYSDEYVLALLNCKLMSWYFHIYMSAFSQLTLHSGNENSRNLPVLKNSLKEQQPFIQLVSRILAAKQADAKADTSALEQQIDALVYQLYGLTDEEIAIVAG